MQNQTTKVDNSDYVVYPKTDAGEIAQMKDIYENWEPDDLIDKEDATRYAATAHYYGWNLDDE